MNRCFCHRGLCIRDKVSVLDKEIELIDLELYSHREMLLQLVELQKTVMLTVAQAKAVADEIQWRRRTVKGLSGRRIEKIGSAHSWGLRLSRIDPATRAEMGKP